MPHSWRLAAAGLAAAGLVTALAGCAPTGRPDLTAAVSPADVAYAVCAQSHPGDEASCAGQSAPDRASAVAYSLCLDYHMLDPAACKALREAYEADLRTSLTAPHEAAQRPEPPSGAGDELAGRSYSAQHRTAEQMYLATSRDAQTFEAAVLIPDVRRKVERLLGPDLTDDKLRAMADKSRAEARYWYGYMQDLERTGTE